MSNQEGRDPEVKQVKPIPPGLIPILKPLLRAMSAVNVWLYRASNGRIMGSFNGAPVCLVTMTGRKSGKQKTTPLIYIPHGEDVLLVASQGGMDKHPLWYFNIASHPEIEIEAEGRRRPMTARRASAEEKRKLWPVCCEVYPDFDDYQARTERDIPLFICSPRA